MSVATLLEKIDAQSRVKGTQRNTRPVREYDTPIRVALTTWLYGIVNKESAYRVGEFAIGHGTVGYADLCVSYPEALHGYEIKSARDSLTRLEYQMRYYDRVFDESTLVTSPEHFTRAQDLVPEHWGLIIARHVGDGIDLEEIRIARPNKHTDIQYALWLLWRGEALEILTRLEPNHKKKYARRQVLYDALQCATSEFVLRRLIVSQLRKRKQWWWDFQMPPKLV